MEKNPISAIRNNAIGTNKLAAVSHSRGVAAFTLVSTDKAANPRSILGASKRVAELAVLRWNDAKSRMKAIRLGNVFGTPGSVVPTFLCQISRGGPVTITHPGAARYFLTLAAAVDAILSVSCLPDGGGVFVPDLGRAVRILDLAHELIEKAGSTANERIAVEFTGLRAGEKLTEDLVSEHESIEPTSHGGLFKIKSPGIHAAAFDDHMARLTETVNRRAAAEMLALVKDMVPEYRASEFLLGLIEQSAARAI